MAGKELNEQAPKSYLGDGTIRFTVRSLDGAAVRELAVDALVLKLVCEEAETAHGYSAGKPVTAAFLKDLAERMKAVGVDECSPSIAYQLWHLAGNAIAELKKNISETPNSPSGSTHRPAARARKDRSPKLKRSVS